MLRELDEGIIVSLMAPFLQQHKLVGKVPDFRWKSLHGRSVLALILGKSMFHGAIGLSPGNRVERDALRDKLLGVGIAGSVAAALCCFTPVPVSLLAAFGLSANAGYLDPILLSALLVFLAITGYAIWRRRRHR